LKFVLAAFAICLATGPLAAAPEKTSPAPPNEDCLTCHEDPAAKRANGTAVFVAKDRFSASVHGQAGLACVDCHADLAKTHDFPHKERLKKVDCAACHDSAGASHSFHPEIARAAEGKGKAQVDCADCHGSHEITPVKDAGFRFAPERQAQACGNCHIDIRDNFVSSEHGKALAKGAKPAPSCLFCHQKGVTAGSGIALSALKKKQEDLCLSCHLYDESVKARAGPAAGFIASFQHSVHGMALQRGDTRAPNCVDCHGAHEERRGFDTSSLVNKMRVQDVCGKCHASENRQFSASVHGAAIERGKRDAPACTDCHGEHSILSPKDPRSPVAAANVSARVCTPCHGSLELTEKYNLPANRSQTFADSYHGLASRGGSVEVANCASCHGAHDILPSSNPASRVNRANLAKTCGASGCHPGANARFGTGKVHVVGTRKESPIIYWITTLYVILIVVVVGGMLGHNLLDFLRKARHQLRIRRGEIVEPPAGRGLYLRMTVSERLQHALLMVSFVLLVLTGFMLRYPESWWVAGIRRLSNRAFDLRSLIHRVSAVVMLATCFYHLGYLLFTPRGRRLLRDLWWRPSDLRDAIGLVRYNVGLSKEKPRLDRFSYIEKAEYWALVWGTVVMAVTGVIMWFDNTFIGLLTKLGYDVSRTIHFYEAWLATLAILVWHFYFVIFNPDSYPMNTAWLTGMLTEREMEEEHPLELERLREAGANPSPAGSPAETKSRSTSEKEPPGAGPEA
jgi:cytochrome b subunit of formate dehydrogenase